MEHNSPDQSGEGFSDASAPELLRSEEVTELIGTRPAFLVRWGITILFCITGLTGLASWFIQYPDVVMASGILCSFNAPGMVIARNEGKLAALVVAEGQRVVKDQLLGALESTADPRSIIALEKMLDSLSSLLSHDDISNAWPFLKNSSYLGELQSAYEVFSLARDEWHEYTRNGFFMRKKDMLSGDMVNLRRLHSEQYSQKELLGEDLTLADSTFVAQEVLKNSKVISPLEYRQQRSALIGKKLTIPQISSSLIANEMQQQEKAKEMAELDKQVVQQRNSFLQALNTLKSQVAEWKRKYLLLAPVAGTISFPTLLEENQEIRGGQIICYVNPVTTNYYAQAIIRQSNFGKVKRGQDVLLKIPAYPWQEYGVLKGKIQFISEAPTDSGYVAKILLPAGLRTSYQRQITYRAGLVLQADIITQDLRLPERLYNSLRKNMSR